MILLTDLRLIGGVAPSPTAAPPPTAVPSPTQPALTPADVSSRDAEFGAGIKKRPHAPVKQFRNPQEQSVEEAVLKRSSMQGSHTLNV